MHLPYHRFFPLLDVCPREMKSYVHMKICSSLGLFFFSFLFFAITKNYKQSTCPSAGKWMNRMLDHTRECCSAIKWNYWYVKNMGNLSSTKWTKPDSKDYTLYGSFYVTCAKTKPVGTEYWWGMVWGREVNYKEAQKVCGACRDVPDYGDGYMTRFLSGCIELCTKEWSLN